MNPTTVNRNTLLALRPVIARILATIQKQIGRDLTPIESDYFKTQIVSVKPHNYGVNSLSQIEDTLIALFLEDIKNPHRVSKALSEPHRYDIHELLKNELSKETNKKSPVNEKNIIPVNTHQILGYDDPYQIRRILNPSSLTGEAYVVLDRRYHLRTDTSRSKFIWNFAPNGQSNDWQTSVTTMAPVNNIVGIEMFPFRMPRHPNAVMSSNRISVYIEEFDNQAYIASEERRRYQFLFKITQNTPVGQYDPLVLEDVTSECTTFNFYRPIKTELNTLTLSFGNPFRTLTLDKDIISATISSSGIQTLLTFDEPHFMSVGDYIIVSTFTTDNPSADYVEIDQINDKDGWAVSALTSTTLTIDVDISGLTGTILNNPHSIYLESKRFVIHMKIKFIKSK